jgi:SAM-dependent methyltransferase
MKIDTRNLAKVTECPACGTGLEFSTQIFSVPLGTNEKVPIHKCLKCHTIYRTVILNSGQLQDHYQHSEYYSFNLQAQPSPGINSRLERIRRVCKPRKILDVGCGDGTMVSAYLGAGWDAYGVDPFLQNPQDSSPVTYGRLFRADISTEILPQTSFDTITLWYVLEHVSNPKTLLTGVVKHLDQGGKVFILVPWAESLASHIYKEHWSEIILAEHLAAYSRSGLEELLSRSGFSNPKFRYAGRPFPLGHNNHSLQSQGLHHLSAFTTNSKRSSHSNYILKTSKQFLMNLTKLEVLGNTSRFIIDKFRFGDYIEMSATRI